MSIFDVLSLPPINEITLEVLDNLPSEVVYLALVEWAVLAENPAAPDREKNADFKAEFEGIEFTRYEALVELAKNDTRITSICRNMLEDRIQRDPFYNALIRWLNDWNTDV